MTSLELFAPPVPETRLRVPSADGTLLNVEVHGPAGTPTVVLIHGWTCNTSFWAPVIRALREGVPSVRVVAYDQRGHGASEAPGKGRYSVPILVEDLNAVLEATLAEGERAVLVGHSMGGMTIMAAAGSAAILSRVGGAVLCSTGFHRLPGSSRVVPGFARLSRVNRAVHRFLLSSALPLGPVNPISRAMLTHTALGPRTDKGLRNVNATMIAACLPKPRAAWGRVLSELDVSSQVALLDVPTSVVFGTKDRLTPAAAHAQAIAAALPRFEGMTTLPGRGHMTPMEAPDAVAVVIRQRVAAMVETPAPSTPTTPSPQIEPSAPTVPAASIEPTPPTALTVPSPQIEPTTSTTSTALTVPSPQIEPTTSTTSTALTEPTTPTESTEAVR